MESFFFLNPSINCQSSKFNLKSWKCPPPIDELKPFEDEMFKAVENLRFEKFGTTFKTG